MDLLEYRFEVESRFSPPISYHAFKLRCSPAENDCQHVLMHHTSISPECALFEASDGFGNRLLYGSIAETHSSFRVVSEGRVKCAHYVIHDPLPSDIYLFPSALTGSSDAMKRIALDLAGTSAQTAASEIMHWVNRHVQYTRLVTHNTTTAQWTFDNGKGVCQDYAHLMIALCRAAGIHARYVAGLVEGEGETHAWVEAYSNGQWTAYDPTYGKTITSGYIKLAHGRDASDCALNRGRFYQWTTECFSVKTVVNKIDL